MLRALSGTVAAGFVALALAACGGAPQIVDYAPDRGATSVATDVRVRIDFDRPVDRASVSSRFSMHPAAEGQVQWASPTEMLYVPEAPLRTDTLYRVVLRAGYRSQGGGAADLDHAWTFRTEGPPQVTAWTPVAGERDVDPAVFPTVSFNHPLSPVGLAGAFTIVPALPVTATVDPSDPFRAVVAPQGLLAPGTRYRLIATSALHDSHGNPLPADAGVTFTTGPIRPLHGWLTCVAYDPGGGGSTGALWAVDPDHFGRQLLPGPVLEYSWAPTADEIAIETAPRAWQDEVLGAAPVSLGVSADLVLPLGGGRGFVVLDQGSLEVLSSSGSLTRLASDVDAVALSRDGSQLAYTVPTASGTQLWGLAVELRSRFLLGTEGGAGGAVAGLAWSPDGARLAYRVVTAATTVVRVRTLAATSAVSVVTGAVEDVAWDSDSQHLYVVGRSGPKPVRRYYRLPLATSGQALPATGGLPAGESIQLAGGPPLPSPDGHQVAFVASLGAGPDEVWLLNADGTGLVRLTGFPGYSYSCRTPRWSPPA